MTTTSTDVQNAFQYYIDYNAEEGKGQLKKIIYDGSQAAGESTTVNSSRKDFSYNIGDTNLNVGFINAKSITTDTLETEKIIMPVNNDPNNTVTVTAIADEDEPPSLNLED